MQGNIQLSKQIILIDASYAETVAERLRKDFAKMLGRDIPKADISYWCDALLLDAGIELGERTIDVMLIHPQSMTQLQHFSPSLLVAELNNKAFKDKLGEFQFTCFSIDDPFTTKDLIQQVIQTILTENQTENLLVVGETDLLPDLSLKDKKVKLTLFNMSSENNMPFQHILLGYSLMHAMQIRSNEF